MNQNDGFAVQLQWVGDLVSPPSPVNQMLILADSPVSTTGIPDLHLLNFGFVSGPAIPGDISEEQIRQLQSQPLPVVPVGRFALTTERLVELRNIIDEHLRRTVGKL